MVLFYYGICANLKVVHMLVMKSFLLTVCCGEVAPDFFPDCSPYEADILTWCVTQYLKKNGGNVVACYFLT